MLQALITAYVDIIKSEPDAAQAAQHLAAFLDDVKRIELAVQEAISAAKQRANTVQP